MIPTVATRATALAVAAFLVLSAGACSRSSGGDQIDPRSLEGELERVIGLELLAAHFFDKDVKVRCAPAADDGLHFSCRVDATNPNEPTQSWDRTVTCRPPDGRDVPRCFTESGDALQ